MCDSIGEKTLFADCAHVVIGVETIRMAGEAKLRVIAIEAGKTLLLERDAIVDLANRSKISIVGRTC